MMKAIRERLGKDEGFTLIELMVVVMIIAVLIAIAIPSFLGFRKSAQDRSAQSELRSVLLAEKAYWLEEAKYTADATSINSFEPSAVINADPTLGVQIVVNTSDDDIVCLVRTSDSGTVWGMWDEDGQTSYGSGTPLSGGACPASAPSGYSTSGF